MKNLIVLAAAIVAASLPVRAHAGTCNPSFADSLPQTSGSIGAVPPNTPGQTPPGQITYFKAVGTGFDVTYTPTVGSPVTSHISIGASSGASCTHAQSSGWVGSQITQLSFVTSGLSTTAYINGSSAPSNTFTCTGVVFSDAVSPISTGITKISAGPGPQDLQFSGYMLNQVLTRPIQTQGSCHLGFGSPGGYTRATVTTGSTNESELWAYGSGGITNVQFYLDGVSKGTDATGVLTSGEYVYQLTSAGTPVGWHQLKAVATFPNGTSSTERRVFFNPRKVVTGDSFTCKLNDPDDGASAQCWGYNGWGQSGTGTTGTSVPQPSTRVQEGDHLPHYNSYLSWITDIAAGQDTVCAVAYGSTSGGVFCWGKNPNGVLGVAPGSLSYSSTPKTIFPVDSGAVAVTVGRTHACAQFSNGTARCWGGGSYGQLGNSSYTSSVTTPTTSLYSDVAKIVAGYDSTYLLRTGGEVYSFGRDNWGQLGNGATLANVSSPVQLYPSGGTALWAGMAHACAVVSGTLKCWGSNPHGEVGNGTTATTQPTPVTATTWTGSSLKDMYLGDSVSCVVTTTGVGKCIGYNGYGNLGIGSTSTHELTPQTPTLYASGVQHMSVGPAHQCAFVGGSFTCAGDNTYDEVHDAALNPQMTPYVVGN